MKRYEEYKTTDIYWLPQIPKVWQELSLRQLFSEVKCKNKGLTEKNLLSLSYGTIKPKSIDTATGLTPQNYEGYNIILPDDIVLRLTDLQNDHKSLRTGLSTQSRCQFHQTCRGIL